MTERNPPIAHSALSVTLRAPRVAVVVDASRDWRWWIAKAVYCCSRVWGGQGFVLVPVVDGRLGSGLLRMVQAYDPDYIVTLDITLNDEELLRPGGRVLRGEDGLSLPPEDRAFILKHQGDDPLDHEQLRAVCERLHRSCASYRMRIEGHDDEDYPLHSLGAGELTRPLFAIALNKDGPEIGPVVADTYTLFEAANSGLSRYPDVTPSHGSPLDAQSRAQVIRSHVGRWLGNEAPDVASPFAATQRGLARIRPFARRRRGPLVVVGDQPHDYALAYAWDRMIGPCVLVPGRTIPDQVIAFEVLRFMWEAQAGRWESRRSVGLTSTSLGFEELSQWLTDLRDGSGLLNVDPERVEIVEPEDMVWVGPAFLALEESYDLPSSSPCRVDHRGSQELLIPLPPAFPIEPVVRDTVAWEVDVRLMDDATPRARHVPRETLLGAGEDTHSTWVRSGHGGISFAAETYGFIPAGASLHQRTAHPRLRFPSMWGWVEARADEADLQIRHSDLGNRTELLARLMASKEALTEAFSGSFRAALTAFIATDKRSDKAYPLGDGVVVERTGYLTFDGIYREVGGAGGITLEDVRARVDDWCQTGLLARGLVLRCDSCSKVQFLPLDRVGRGFTCQRCGDENALAQPTWNLPEDEPKWFYDLHVSARDLLSGDGGLVLQASHYLRTKGRRYEDVSEVEFADNGKGVAEADLISCLDDRVLVAEVKSTPDLGDAYKSRAQKLARMAAVVQADEILLVTSSETGWKTKDINALRAALAGVTQGGARPPAIRAITGIGGAQPSEELQEPPGVVPPTYSRGLVGHPAPTDGSSERTTEDEGSDS